MSFAGDLENGVGVASIDPKANELILKNGDKYRYKNLVDFRAIVERTGHITYQESIIFI